MSNITGRDHPIICKALAYAIESIERLPTQWREASDQSDMIKLLNTISTNADYYRTGARAHLERRGVTVQDGVMVLADREPGAVVEHVFPPPKDGP